MLRFTAPSSDYSSEIDICRILNTSLSIATVGPPRCGYIGRSSVSASMLVQLQWLKMDERISFKIALLACESIHGLAPEYLSTYCIPVSSLPSRSHPRSAGEWKMLVPRTETVSLGPPGFFWARLSTWNALSVPLRDFELSSDSFKWKLKSHSCRS